MSTPTPPIESLTLRKKLPCSPEQAFRAWTDPEQFQQWFVAMPGMTVKAQMDVRLGGKYRISCARAGEPTKFVGGEFLVVDPPRRLEYTWIWEKEAMPEWKDRSVVKLAFSLAFAQDPASPEVRFAVCQHHYPENFWNPDFQRHANGAKRLLGVVLVADKPAAHAAVLCALAGGVAPQSEADGISVPTPNGEMSVITPAAFRARFGVAPAIAGEGMALNALRMSVADLDATSAILQKGGVPAGRQGNCLVIPPAAASGATLVFEAA